MFRRLKIDARISSDLNEIAASEKLLLPGVGAFDGAMKRIDEAGFREVLNRKALEEKVPILGICLGMQLLTEGSDEGKRTGLGWIPAYTKRMKSAKGMPVPHMGWSEVQIQQDTPFVEGLEALSLEDERPRFYFVHSYEVHVKNASNSLMRTSYTDEFDSAILHENIIGCQFHPEKSHKFGMQLFRNFAQL